MMQKSHLQKQIRKVIPKFPKCVLHNVWVLPIPIPCFLHPFRNVAIQALFDANNFGQDFIPVKKEKDKCPVWLSFEQCDSCQQRCHNSQQLDLLFLLFFCVEENLQVSFTSVCQFCILGILILSPRLHPSTKIMCGPNQSLQGKTYHPKPCPPKSPKLASFVYSVLILPPRLHPL